MILENILGTPPQPPPNVPPLEDSKGENKLAEIIPQPEPVLSALRITFDRLNSAIDACCEEERLGA